MERLTTNKSVADMSMVELAHNSCYADSEGNARYRDYEMEMDARDFARNLMVTLTKDELPVDDAEFDEEMLDNLMIDPFSDVRGLIALFYRNMWAMADLREKLKHDEDAAEQGLILGLPCGIGTTVYEVENNADACSECNDFERGYYCDDWCGKKDVYDEDGDVYVTNPQYADKPLCPKQFYEVNEYTMNNVDEIFKRRNSFDKTVFLTREEAEENAKLLNGRK